MQEHLTSWSGISKALVGRTENSIKNYFYSTVRRIQACPVIDYITKLKQGKPVPAMATEEIFAEAYELDKLNHLGVVICRWLYKSEEVKYTHAELYKYLVHTIADEKKKHKLPQKDFSSLNNQQQNSTTAETVGISTTFEQPQAVQSSPYSVPFINPKSLNGVHPLLPMALYGGLSNMNAKHLFQNYATPTHQHYPYHQETYAPKNIGRQIPSWSDHDGRFSDEFSNISVPIPSNGTVKKRPSEVQESNNSSGLQLQQALLNVLVQKLASAVDKNNTNRYPTIENLPPHPAYPFSGGFGDSQLSMTQLMNILNEEEPTRQSTSKVCYKCIMKKDRCKHGC